MSEPQNTPPEEGIPPLAQESASKESGEENVQTASPENPIPQETPLTPEAITGESGPKKARRPTGVKKATTRKKPAQENQGKEEKPKPRTRKPRAEKPIEPVSAMTISEETKPLEDTEIARTSAPDPQGGGSDKPHEQVAAQEDKTQAKAKKETFFGNILLLVTVAVFGGGLLYGGYTVLVKRGKLPAWGAPAPKEVAADPTATPVNKPSPSATPKKEEDPRPELLGFSVSEERKPHTLYPTKSSQFTAIQTKVLGTAFSATDAKKVYLVVENPDDPQAEPICAETRTTGIITRVKSGEIKIGDTARITLGKLDEKTKTRYETDRQTVSNTYKVPADRFFDIEEYEILTDPPSPAEKPQSKSTPNSNEVPTPFPTDPPQIFLQGTTTEQTP